jgi:hypothetical protein
MFIRHEAALFAVLKSSLLKMFSKSFKNLNMDDSSLNLDKSSQKLLSYFSSNKSRVNQSENNTSQLTSMLNHDENLEEENKQETMTTQQHKSKKNDDKKRSRKSCSGEEDQDETISRYESSTGVPKSKIPKITMYLNNESSIVETESVNNKQNSVKNEIFNNFIN